MPTPNEAEGTLAALPPGHGFETKYIYGISLAGRLIGCVDLIRGFPELEKAMLGLLLLREDAHGAGHGRRAYEEVEKVVATWPEIRTIRLGVVEINAGAIGFWEKMGFKATGARRLYEQGSVRSQTVVLEKAL